MRIPIAWAKATASAATREGRRLALAVWGFGESAPEALRGYGRASFRVYRTAAGFRAIALDREFDPTARDTQELMQRTATDAAYMQLCRAQRSFRARLTPKPWRAECPLPPGAFPREDEKLRKRFASWLRRYESARAHYRTCRYLETIGSGRPSARNARLIELHDRETGVEQALNLA